jgi:hypothetical protein
VYVGVDVSRRGGLCGQPAFSEGRGKTAHHVAGPPAPDTGSSDLASAVARFAAGRQQMTYTPIPLTGSMWSSLTTTATTTTQVASASRQICDAAHSRSLHRARTASRATCHRTITAEPADRDHRRRFVRPQSRAVTEGMVGTLKTSVPRRENNSRHQSGTSGVSGGSEG